MLHAALPHSAPYWFCPIPGITVPPSRQGRWGTCKLHFFQGVIMPPAGHVRAGHLEAFPLPVVTAWPELMVVFPAGDSWGIFAFLCAALWNLPAVPALNNTDEAGAGQSIQKTYDLTRYLEHQLRTLAGTYVSTG